MRITALLLILGLAATAAAADQPATPAAPAASAAAPAVQVTPAAAPAAAATAANTNPGGVSNDTLKKATRMGLKPRQRKGTTMFCKDYADIGTRIPSEHCYAADTLDDIIRQMEEAQDMKRRAGACPNMSCGGG